MDKQKGTLSAEGTLDVRRTRDLGTLSGQVVPASLAWKIKNFVQHKYRGVAQTVGSDMLGRMFGTLSLQPSLSGRVYRPSWGSLATEQQARLRALLGANVDVTSLVGAFGGSVVDYGVMSTRVVTTAGVYFLCDAFQGLATLANIKYHGFGTGGTAEAIGDTLLVTELTTQYAVDNTRVTGTQVEGGSQNVYRSVATLSPDTGGTIAITEHGLFSAAASGAVTLWDRSLFTAVNLVAGSDSLQVTYDLTLTAGG